jgi:hypothetical protein
MMYLACSKLVAASRVWSIFLLQGEMISGLEQNVGKQTLKALENF